MKEIEIKVQIQRISKLLSFLEKDAKLVKEERQVDEYFSPKEHSFIAEEPVKEWLRLRNENGKVSLNHKLWHYDADGRSNYCDEYETSVENADELKNILIALRFEPIITVDKNRKSYLYKKYEISLDQVKSLGEFVEIELRDSTENPEGATKEMMEFLKKFDVGTIERNYKGYPKLLLERTKLKP